MFRTHAVGHILGNRCSRRTGSREGDLRQAEVENLGVPAFGHKDIGGFDVAVNDAFGVCGIQGVGDFNRKREQKIGIDGPSVDAMLQRHAIEKFHGNERLPVLLADVVNRADVVVI